MTEAKQTPMLEIRDIKRDYRVPQGVFKQDKIVHAVKGVSFKLGAAPWPNRCRASASRGWR